MSTAFIAEDEAPQRAELRELLAQLWPDLEVVAECADGLSALEAVHALKPQVGFLDIRMPGISGLEVARAAQGTSHIVFTTAYDEYAVQAFERGALDFVLKPIRRERLAQTVQRVRERVARREAVDMLEAIDALQRRIADAQRPDRIKWITASVGMTTKLFPIDDVLYFKAEDKYTCVVTSTDRAHIRMSLRELADGLDPQAFWQVHRAVIVRTAAIRCVRKTDDGKLALQLKDSAEELPISAAFQYRFRPM